MRGEVTLQLNQLSVEEAIQNYLDTHLVPQMKLKSFEYKSGSSYGASYYECVLEEVKVEL